MDEILKIDRVSKYFIGGSWLFNWISGKRKASVKNLIKAVDDVSFSVYRGEALGILGESGSGKSTLVRTIARLIHPTSGRVLWNNRDIFSMSNNEVKTELRPKMRMIFQHPEAVLNPAFSIKQTLQQALNQHSTTEKTKQVGKIEVLLKNVGLSKEVIQKYPHELSGGQKRRIGICRALATEPEMILADEPTSGLDTFIQQQIVFLLKDVISANGISMILISHDLGIVSQICDRIGIMYQGNVVELGPTNTIITGKSRHPYTQFLFASKLTLEKFGEKVKPEIKTEIPSSTRLGMDGIPCEKGCPYTSCCSLWNEKGKPEVCIQHKPRLEDKGNGHFIACHLKKTLESSQQLLKQSN